MTRRRGRIDRHRYGATPRAGARRRERLAPGRRAAMPSGLDLPAKAPHTRWSRPDLLIHSALGPSRSTTATAGGTRERRSDAHQVHRTNDLAKAIFRSVELRGLEPLTFSLRRHRVHLLRREYRVIDVHSVAAQVPLCIPGAHMGHTMQGHNFAMATTPEQHNIFGTEGPSNSDESTPAAQPSSPKGAGCRPSGSPDEPAAPGRRR